MKKAMSWLSVQLEVIRPMPMSAEPWSSSPT